MTLTISFRQNRATLQDIENVKAKIIEAYQKTIIFIVSYAGPTLWLLQTINKYCICTKTPISHPFLYYDILK